MATPPRFISSVGSIGDADSGMRVGGAAEADGVDDDDEETKDDAASSSNAANAVIGVLEEDWTSCCCVRWRRTHSSNGYKLTILGVEFVNVYNTML